MEKIVVNDTNVFIDLFNVGLLEEFFSLPWEIHTTNFVMLELQREGQQASVSHFRDTDRLHVPVFEQEELTEIVRMYHRYYGKMSNVSMTDCSVWYYAKVNHYMLLTGDRKLRNASHFDGVEVHGVIYVFDSLVASGIIPQQTAAEKLKQLYSLNSRLPKDELDRRLKDWLPDAEEKVGSILRSKT